MCHVPRGDHCCICCMSMSTCTASHVHVPLGPCPFPPLSSRAHATSPGSENTRDVLCVCVCVCVCLPSSSVPCARVCLQYLWCSHSASWHHPPYTQHSTAQRSTAHKTHQSDATLFRQLQPINTHIKFSTRCFDCIVHVMIMCCMCVLCSHFSSLTHNTHNTSSCPS